MFGFLFCGSAVFFMARGRCAGLVAWMYCIVLPEYRKGGDAIADFRLRIGDWPVCGSDGAAALRHRPRRGDVDDDGEHGIGAHV